LSSEVPTFSVEYRSTAGIWYVEPCIKGAVSVVIAPFEVTEGVTFGNAE
jgi:hypothetical protein